MVDGRRASSARFDVNAAMIFARCGASYLLSCLTRRSWRPPRALSLLDVSSPEETSAFDVGDVSQRCETSGAWGVSPAWEGPHGRTIDERRGRRRRAARLCGSGDGGPPGFLGTPLGPPGWGTRRKGAHLARAGADQVALELGQPAQTVSIERPCAVVVSAHVSLRERKPAPLAVIVASVFRRPRVERRKTPAGRGQSFVTATQSTSTSKGPVHSGTQKKMRAGGFFGK
jgi:hypothetical protein